MKLIIDIPDDLYDGIECRNPELETEYVCNELMKAVDNGTLLDDVKEEIEQDMSFDMFDDYGNKTRIHKELWGILDNIGKESEEE